MNKRRGRTSEHSTLHGKKILILLDSNGFHWLLLGCLASLYVFYCFFCVLLASTLLHWVLLYATGFYCMLLASTRFYWVILASIARGANNFLSELLR